jgi:hypothetical protein
MRHKFNKRFSLTTFGIIALSLFISSCEREVSDDAIPATYPSTADIFIDSPVGLTDAFFESFDPASGANPTGFNTDNEVAYSGSTSIRIDVPTPTDPNGSYIGGIFRDRGAGRNLTSYDALTFWVKGSTTATIGTAGFGTDFGDNKYSVTMDSIQLSTNWRKIIIPIPDPSKLTQERGMFIFSAGTQSTNGVGYTFWIDELRFEKLGNIALINAFILNSQNITLNTYTGANQTINGLGATFNLSNGQNVTVNAALGYFNFMSSNSNVATVFENGVVNVIGLSGSSVISANVGNVAAQGSLLIYSNGNFPQPIAPTNPAANVRSVFSDAYINVVSPNFTPAFGGSTTTTTIDTFNGNQIATYSNNNFTGIMFVETPINATTMTFMHVDVFVPTAATSVEFQIRDIGPNQTIETNVNNGNPIGDDKDKRFTASGLLAGQWNSINIPLNGNLTSQRNNIGAIILAGGPNFILDNIYFYFP